MAKTKRPPTRGMTYLDRLKAQRDNEFRVVETWSIQLTADVFCAILNRECGFGAERLERICKAFLEAWPDYRDAITKHPESDYIRAQIDREQERIFKDKFIPWEERYDGWA